MKTTQISLSEDMIAVMLQLMQRGVKTFDGPAFDQASANYHAIRQSLLGALQATPPGDAVIDDKTKADSYAPRP